MKTFLTVIIPCYNELANLKRGVLDQIHRYLKLQDYSWEVIISNDSSTDGSIEFIDKYTANHHRFSHLKNPKGGKAFAIRSGVGEAKGEYVLFLDMDQSTPISELEKLAPHLNHYDIVIGSRGFKRENFPLTRKIASPLFLLFRRLLILPHIQDTQCGFKLFKKTTVEKIMNHLSVFRRPPGSGWKVGAWDVELLYIATKLGIGIKEVTVEWRDTDTSNSKQRKFIQESVEMVMEILHVRKNNLLGYYDFPEITKG